MNKIMNSMVLMAQFQSKTKTITLWMFLVFLSIGIVQAENTKQPETLFSQNGIQESSSGLVIAANNTQNTATISPAVNKVKHSKVSTEGKSIPSQYWVVNTLRAHTELAIFLTLALGYYIGAIKLGSFSLGAVTGTLLVGVLIGQLDIAISSQVKSIFFKMFLFAIGYSVGPQFVRGVARDGAPQAIFAVVVSVLCLVCTYFAAKIAGFNVGLAAGMLAGAQTISASIGLATDAINNSGISNSKDMLDQLPIAYAICYIYGTVGTGMILSMLGPKLLGVNLEDECKKYEAELSKGQPDTGMNSAWHQLEMRAFEVSTDNNKNKIVGNTVANAEALYAEERLYIERIRHNGELIEFEPSTLIQVGDILAVSGPTEVLIELEKNAKEVADQELLDIPVESVDLVITHKNVNGETLIELAKEEFARGVYLQSITRSAVSVDVPILAQTKIYRGDILKLSGTRSHIDRISEAIGYVDRPSVETDMVWVGVFIVVFGLLGALSMNIGGVPVTLSSSGGVLIGGLVLGWLRGVYPTFGRLPTPTQWFMNSVGLNVFIAIVGISAGPKFITGIMENGVSLLIWGLVATSLPMILAPLIGKYIFKFHPAINLGCCGGARTSTASVAMVSDVAKSNIPMLGYTVPYAVSNTLLTLWGMVIVLMY